MESYLLPNEKIMKRFGKEGDEVVLTNIRVIKFWKKFNERDFHDIHYRFVESIRHSASLNWSMAGFGFIFLILGFLLIGLNENLMAFSIACWVLGILIISQVYIFQKHFIEIRSPNSIMIVPNNVEIAFLIRKYQSLYFGK